jgi:hypothetical protein
MCVEGINRIIQNMTFGFADVQCYMQDRIRLAAEYGLRPCFRSGHVLRIQKNTSAVIFKQTMEARNRVGIGLSYRPAWQLVPWNRFLGYLKV